MKEKKGWQWLRRGMFTVLLTSAFMIFATESRAAEQTVSGEMEVVPGQDEWEESELGSREELFEAYAAKRLGMAEDISFFSTDRAGSHLTGNNKMIYDGMKSMVSKIAAGEGSKAVLDVPFNELKGMPMTFTPKDLGLTEFTIEGQKYSSQVEEALANKLSSLMSEAFDASRILTAVKNDCPYEFYWWGRRWVPGGYQYGYTGNSSQITLDSSSHVSFRFCVDSLYRGTSEGDDEYTADTRKTGEVTRVLNNVEKIVKDAADKSDYEKLVYYKKKLCELNTYNHEAADSTSETRLTMAPWEIIYMFDEDDTSNVVCEGYAKAFAYLCERTIFDSDKISAYTVSGDMNGGAHEWNVVHMDDDKNYLVDVTNCDDDASGNPDYLFLQGYDSQLTSGGEVVGYQIDIPKIPISDTSYRPAISIQYVYDAQTMEAYSREELALSSGDYSLATHTDANKDGYCDEEGCGTVMPAAGAALAGHTLFLGDDIDVCFYMEFTNKVMQNKDAYVELQKPDGTTKKVYINGEGHEGEEIASCKSVGGKMYYVFPVGVNATQMSDTVSAQLHAGDMTGISFEYTVKEYIDAIMNDDTYQNAKEDSSDSKEVQRYYAYQTVVALGTYGSYAQEYFGHNAQDGKWVLPPAQRISVKNGVTTYAGGKRSMDIPLELEEFDFAHASLILDSRAKMRLYFTYAEDIDPQKDIKIWDHDQGADNESGECYSIKYNKKHDLYYIETKGNFASQAWEPAYLYVKVKEKEPVVCRYSPFTYCDGVLARDDIDESTKALIRSYLLYTEQAYNYSQIMMR